MHDSEGPVILSFRMILISCMTEIPCRCGTLKTAPDEGAGRKDTGCGCREGPAARESRTTSPCSLASPYSQAEGFPEAHFPAPGL